MASSVAAPNALFDASTAERLAEIMSPVFTLILQLRSAADFGDPDTLRQRIKGLLERCEREAQRSGASAREVSEAKFALVAFLDETILSSDWYYKDQWVANPLQLEVYNRYDAGDEFFVKLKPLMDQPQSMPEVLEVYYLCMTLGFKGQYLVHDQGELRLLIDDAARSLSRIPGFGASLLSPHGRPRGQVTTEVRRKLPAWVIVVAAATVGMLIYVTLLFYMRGASSETATRIDNTEQTDPRGTP
ncbi:MAG: type IVB secretion system protein IcmH/DotU [Bacteroidota bacterium]